MINSSQVMTESLNGDTAVFVPTTFYVVGRKKLAILFLATLGLYGFYWFYKNWSNYKHYISNDFNPDRSVWPAPRALFSVFFTHALFREVKAYGHDKAEVAGWNNGSQATKLVLIMILSSVLDRLSRKSIGSPYTDIASLVILAPWLAQLLDVQQMINISCGDRAGESNVRFTKANYAWITLGVIFWILIGIGLFLPD